MGQECVARCYGLSSKRVDSPEKYVRVRQSEMRKTKTRLAADVRHDGHGKRQLTCSAWAVNAETIAKPQESFFRSGL